MAVNARPSADDKFLEIDPDNLDINSQDQPKLMRYWCRQLALAEKKAQDAKNNVKLVWSDMRNRIRESPLAFRLEKVTVDTVDDAATTSPEYQDALRLQADADLQAALIKANVEALRSRDYQLTNQGELLKLGYFTAPRIDPQTRERYLANKSDYVNQGVINALNDNNQDSKSRPRSRK